MERPNTTFTLNLCRTLSDHVASECFACDTFTLLLLFSHHPSISVWQMGAVAGSWAASQGCAGNLWFCSRSTASAPGHSHACSPFCSCASQHQYVLDGVANNQFFTTRTAVVGFGDELYKIEALAEAQSSYFLHLHLKQIASCQHLLMSPEGFPDHLSSLPMYLQEEWICEAKILLLIFHVQSLPLGILLYTSSSKSCVCVWMYIYMCKIIVLKYLCYLRDVLPWSHPGRLKHWDSVLPSERRQLQEWGLMEQGLSQGTQAVHGRAQNRSKVQNIKGVC